ncbi:MAG: GIY-YIG nuclease family protein [Verrucomicrobiota bacterium]|jgi:Uri superfamily endonuclease
MELPDERGTYILIASVLQMKRLKIGRLGNYDLLPGFYAYVGSAFGPGGLRARIHHHLESVAEPHWHIDYLLGYAEPVEVWYALSGRKREQDLAELLAQASGFRMPIHRFGSSDYRRSRTSHLFYSKRRPSFRWFQHQVGERFGADIAVEQYRIGPEQPASDQVSP